MSNYLTPGVYIEDMPNALIPQLVGDSELTGGFMGIAQRGPVGIPQEITSWSGYVNTFAHGMPSPFIAESELAYAVYGFFQNGGSRCYVMRVAHTKDVVVANNATAASVTVENGYTLTAKDEGVWGNDIEVRIFDNPDLANTFNIIVRYKNEVKEQFNAVTNSYDSPRYWVSVLSASRFIKGSGALKVTDIDNEGTPVPTFQPLSGGTDGLANIVDGDYVGEDGLINNFDVVDDINLLSAPGVTSDAVIQGVLEYCNNREYLLAVLDCDLTETEETLVAALKTLKGNGVIAYPWGKVVEPMSHHTLLHDCPPSGHMQGVYARIARTRGIWKAPAGTEATVRGFVDTVRMVTNAHVEILNPLGAVCLISKAPYGIVVWGARTVSNEFVSHVLLDQYIKKTVYNGTQSFVFEVNNPDTWNRMQTVVEAFLNTLWQRGGLAGEDASSAYYVKCDETLNTPEAIRDGFLFCEVGYKRQGVAEFIVFRFSHEIIK